MSLTDDDRFLIAEARRIGPVLRARISDSERLAGELLRQLADLAERLAADEAPQAVVAAWCKGCHRATPSVMCGQCGKPAGACANCGRCPDCDGPL